MLSNPFFSITQGFLILTCLLFLATEYISFTHKHFYNCESQTLFFFFPFPATGRWVPLISNKFASKLEDRLGFPPFHFPCIVRFYSLFPATEISTIFSSSLHFTQLKDFFLLFASNLHFPYLEDRMCLLILPKKINSSLHPRQLVDHVTCFYLTFS